MPNFCRKRWITGGKTISALPILPTLFCAVISLYEWKQQNENSHIIVLLWKKEISFCASFHFYTKSTRLYLLLSLFVPSKNTTWTFAMIDSLLGHNIDYWSLPQTFLINSMQDSTPKNGAIEKETSAVSLSRCQDVTTLGPRTWSPKNLSVSF